MEIYERIKLLRKVELKLSREVFAERLGVTFSVIKNIENNLLTQPEKKEPLYKLICKEFNVSYEWLTTGNGEMFIESEEAIISALVDEFNLDEIGVSILTAYKGLDAKQREGVRAFITEIAKDVILNKPHLLNVESAPLAHIDKAIENANEKTRLYIAAKSEEGKEHRIIDDGQDMLDDLKKAKHTSPKTIEDF